MSRMVYDPYKPIATCPVCGRPSLGADRCPKAIDPRLDCPHDPHKHDTRKRLRKVGR